MKEKIVSKVVESLWDTLDSKPERLAMPNFPEGTSFALTKNYHVSSEDIVLKILEMLNQDIELGRYEEIIKKIRPKKSNIADIISNLDKNEETYKNIQNKITYLETTMKEDQLALQSKSGELKATKKQFSDEEKQIQKDKEKIAIFINRINSDFANKNDELDKLLKTINYPTTAFSDMLTNIIDEVDQLLEARKEFEKENKLKLDASEAAMKIKQESAELESNCTLFQEVKESLNPSAFPEYVLNQVIENILSRKGKQAN